VVADPFEVLPARGGGSASSIVLRLHVQPGARKVGVTGLFGDALKVKVTAPPADGRANVAVVELVAGLLGVRTGQVQLVSGQSSRSKRLEVQGVDPEDARQRVRAALEHAAGNKRDSKSVPPAVL
jgi:uncharacterized protein (TIGR00251 family)